ncbi:hypothetical protein [Carboxylicivirga marina]|uniref:Uncharacterized protein n=1 Tax=Carboxylicivirga marina TaxID=2800988 RepID=A0ABS1HPP0_9BACT|nr:hypothetical protein [Carboxylicivirga marina]MBK3519644.1 hypothetical protein [Carboxylicivirga marina]
MTHFGNQFDADDYLKSFKEKEQFFDALKEALTLDVYSLISKHHSHSKYNKSMENAIATYANDIINTTESVIDKDEHYPEYRKQKELNSITKLLNKVLSEVDEDDFLEQMHLCCKKLISQYYPGILHLSNYGFRLLERNSKMYTASFILSLKQKQLIDVE